MGKKKLKTLPIDPGDYILEKIWWKLKIYMCTRIHRDRKWFREKYPLFKEFWKDVLHYRKVGVEELLPKKREKKKVECLI
jgi:hypothetical protein